MVHRRLKRAQNSAFNPFCAVLLPQGLYSLTSSDYTWAPGALQVQDILSCPRDGLLGRAVKPESCGRDMRTGTAGGHVGQSVDWNPAVMCPEYSAACQCRGVLAGSMPLLGSGQGVCVAPGWGAGQLTQVSRPGRWDQRALGTVHLGSDPGSGWWPLARS